MSLVYLTIKQKRTMLRRTFACSRRPQRLGKQIGCQTCNLTWPSEKCCQIMQWKLSRQRRLRITYKTLNKWVSHTLQTLQEPCNNEEMPNPIPLLAILTTELTVRFTSGYAHKDELSVRDCKLVPVEELTHWQIFPTFASYFGFIRRKR